MKRFYLTSSNRCTDDYVAHSNTITVIDIATDFFSYSLKNTLVYAFVNVSGRIFSLNNHRSPSPSLLSIFVFDIRLRSTYCTSWSRGKTSVLDD